MTVLWGLCIAVGIILAGVCFYQYKRLCLIQTMLDLVSYPLWVSNRKDELLYCNQSYQYIFHEGQSKKIKAVCFSRSPYRKTVVVEGERRLFDFYQKSFGRIKVAWGIDYTHTDASTQELKRHVGAYQEVLENLSAGISIYGPDRRLKFYNHAYAHMFSFNKEWLNTQPSLGEIIDDLLSRRLLTEHANHKAYRQREMERAVSALTPHEELIHLPNERSFRRITAPHPLGGSFYVFEDVTTSLSLERQYNTQIAVQKASLDNLFEGIAVFGSDNRLQLTNPAFDRLWDNHSFHAPPWGRHISELLDTIQNFLDFKESWETYRDDLISRMTDRVPKHYKFTRKDKKVISFSYIPLPDGSHLMTFVDVTDSYNMEHVLREKNKLLETNDRLRSDFIANVSSELRNPLQAILGFTELLSQKSYGELNEHQQGFCGHILTSTHVLLDLAQAILDISTLESGALVLKYQIIDIRKLLTSVIRVLQDRARHMNVNIVLKTSKNLGTMQADKARLKQIVFNILSACLQKAQEQDLILTVHAQDADINFKISMAETFKKSELKLGLSLVKRLVDLHGGTFFIHENDLGFKIPRFKT